jgi:hypothetical protein
MSMEKELLELGSYYDWYRGSYYNVSKLFDNKLIISTASTENQSIYYDLVNGAKKELGFAAEASYQDDKYIYYNISGKLYKIDKSTYKEEQIFEMEKQYTYTSYNILYANDKYAILYDNYIYYIDFTNKTMTEMNISDNNVKNESILVTYNPTDYLDGKAYFSLEYYFLDPDGYGYEYYQIVTSKVPINDDFNIKYNYVYYIEGSKLKKFNAITKKITKVASDVEHLFSDIDGNLFYTDKNSKVIKVEN